METKKHLATLQTAGVYEFLGPAEGQYVTLQGTLATNSPSPGGRNCYDVYTFEIKEESAEICIELSTESALEAGALYPRLFSFATCEMVGQGEGLDAGETSAGFCTSGGVPMAPGTYHVFISGEGLNTPVAYSLRIEATVPISAVVQVGDEDCDAQDGCI